MSTFTFHAPCTLINANHRHHWAAKAKLTRAWREVTAAQYRKSAIPPMDTAHVTITIGFGDNRRRDIGNLQPTAKAIVDGLIDGGLMADDDDAHLTGPDLRRGPKVDGRVPVITVELRETA